MSKSLNGTGSLNLTLNELRLLEIKATTLHATNGTITGLLTVKKNSIFEGARTLRGFLLENQRIFKEKLPKMPKVTQL
jgi:hypothetical protein